MSMSTAGQGCRDALVGLATTRSPCHWRGGSSAQCEIQVSAALSWCRGSSTMTSAPVNIAPPEDRSDLDERHPSATWSAPGGALSKKQIQAMEVGAGFAMLFSVSGFIVFMR